MNDGTEPVLDSEILYRRIPCNPEYYNPDIDPPISPESFRPRKDDLTGFSVSRAKFKTMQQVAVNDRGSKYYVASLLAGKLRENDIDIEPDPLSGDLGHAKIPNLTYENRKTPRAKEIKVLLALKLCESIDGPF